jgi:dinuclear metal center YbgI/SA1388 family protein
MPTVLDVVQHLEQIAPPVYQEGYDNAGLIVGDRGAEVRGILTCLDSTEPVVAEAIRKGCNLIVAHHPIVFKGLKSLTGRNYVERTILEAIRNDIAIYAIHTNLDNVLSRGVNERIGQQLGIANRRILAPKKVLLKVITTVPYTHVAEVHSAMVEAGAQHVSVIEQMSLDNGAPPSGQEENLHGRLVRLEAMVTHGVQGPVIQALGKYHPFEEVPYHTVSLESTYAEIGSGMLGELPEPMAEEAFLDIVKERMQAGCIRHTALRQKKVERVAWCGGAGRFLLPAAKAAGADVFVTSDYKYHEFFDADSQIVIADIGHFESEQYTIQLLQEILSEKFSIFATYSTEVRTNPVFYR